MEDSEQFKREKFNYLIILDDGAVQHGVAGCRGVLRDHQGAWIGGYAKNISTTNVFIAELWGVYEGLCLAQQRCFELKCGVKFTCRVVLKSNVDDPPAAPRDPTVTAGSVEHNNDGTRQVYGWKKASA
ncbi:non-LTR retroelement reverse transcriptase [Trifolium pratense]|uniref:Non-LTR retroelement reverse transcriptase n=1 Tax=Trifolium pratense TaxID=57577 RepID=A0A2K3N254_TRIPR|nr:non-LTR retroelement reverse transcriptase [Trifolium pratense]